MMNDHECARCGGEGTPYPSSPIKCDIDCGRCRGSGRCSSYIDPSTGECVLCGWHYDGPEHVGDTTGDSSAVRAELADKARRMK